MNKIPILLYHDFCSETDKSKDNFCVTWDNFKAQMDYLHLNGFVGISLEKMTSADKETRKKVVLTFDDGDISNYHYVFPTLKEKGFTATFFVTINEIGKEHKMDWPMIYDLSKNGMDIGSHGLTHSFFTAHNNYTLLNELLMSKQVLEKYTRKRVDFLSIPQGFYNKRVLTIAKDVGFRAVCVSDAGYNDFSDETRFVLKRFTMRRNYKLKAFKSVVCGRPALTIAAAENLRKTLRTMLGWQVYDRLRRASITVSRLRVKKV